MNVAENLLLQQMQNMASLPKTANNSGSKDNSFQDLMGQQKDTVDTNTGKDSGAEPVRKEDGGSTSNDTEAPVQKKPGEEEKPQDLHGDPNAAVYVMELFRPEIVDVSQPEAAAEVPVELAPVEADVTVEADVGTEAAPVVETAAPVETEAVVQEAPQEFRQVVEQTAEAAPETVQPVETEKAADVPQDTRAETVEKTTDTGELQDVRPAEETAEESDGPQEESVDVDSQPVFHDVEAAPVKVAENYHSVDTEAPDMEENLADTILTAVQNGAEKIEIQLSPANLGALTITLARDTTGALEVVIHTATSKAAGLLNQHLDGLHTALQTYGNQQPVHVEVQRGQESQEHHMFQQADPDGRGQQQRQQQEDKKENKESGEDFLQKLRLGLTGLE